jgi:hypothetical protein
MAKANAGAVALIGKLFRHELMMLCNRLPLLDTHREGSCQNLQHAKQRNKRQHQHVIF